MKPTDLVAADRAGAPTRKRRRAGYKLPLLAFLVQGGWTLFVNYSAGRLDALRSALAQGAASAVSTYIMTVIMLWIFCKIRHDILATVSSVLASSGLMLAVLVALHILMGTAHIFATLTLPFTAIMLYAIIYSLRLYRIRRIEGV